MRNNLIFALIVAVIPVLGYVARGFSERAWAGDDERSLPGPVLAVVTKIVDGDTVGVRARIWLGQDVETLVRLRGVDAPELHSRCASERDLARDARDLLASRVDGQVVQLLDISADKYGNRVVARLLTRTGQDLSRLLQDAGLAHAYDGGGKSSWCDN